MKDDQNKIRVLTWNIHSGIGPDGTYDLVRIVNLIRHHDPDIIALQEVDSRGHSDTEKPLPFLKTALGSHAAEARTIITPDGHYGHVVISRWPFTEVTHHDISVSRRERRCAIETMIETPWGPLHFVAAHLGLSPFERRKQARVLANLARRDVRPTIMLGDFNDWLLRGTVRRALDKIMPGHTTHRTFPAKWPLLSLDKVYCRPRNAIIRSWTDNAARVVSDHLPVFADIRLS